jgi:hypothetical protein
VIVISKKLFCFILIGLSCLAVASICSILHLPMDKAVILFIGTWIVLVALFEKSSWLESHNYREPPEEP